MEQPAAQDPLIGLTIGNYEVRKKLGEGGMGSVYMAEHPMIGKQVAVKVLHAEFASNEDVVARFFNEAKAVNDIQHPNIVDIVDYGVIPHLGGNMVYFIMEFLGGEALADLIAREAPLGPERALTIALQIADALGSSHSNNVVHRDLKPDNVMLTQRGRDRDFVKVLDFGIAKLTGDQKGSRRTRTGIVMGTPAYMSPEQCEGKGNIDRRTDIYALGILLYEMITGQVPFVGEGYGEVLVKHLTQIPQRPSTIRGVIPPHVEAIVMKALEKNPEARYPSMETFMLALQDPVGYVEAHGGLEYFSQANLTSAASQAGTAIMSGTPMTPSPIASLTPAPGTLTPVPGNPTTLTSGAGQVGASGGGGSRVGLIAVVALLVLGLGGGGVYLASSGGSDDDKPGVSAKSDDPDELAKADELAKLKAAADAKLKAAADAKAKAEADAKKKAEEIARLKAKLPGADGKVTIVINSEPSGAKVFIGGKEVGETPFELKTKKSKKALKVRLKKDGYHTKTKTVVPSANKEIDTPLKSRTRVSSKKSGPRKTGPKKTDTKKTGPKKTGPKKIGEGTMAPTFGK